MNKLYLFYSSLILILILNNIKLIKSNNLSLGNCGGNKFQINNVSVEINNELQTINFKIQGILKEDVENGNIFSIITTNTSLYLKEEQKFCDSSSLSSSSNKIKCPIKSGEISYNLIFNIKNEQQEIPREYFSTIWFTDQVPDQIGCFNYPFSF